MTRLELAPSTLNIDGGQSVVLYEAVERMLYEAVERMLYEAVERMLYEAVERMTRLELATSTLGRSRSTN
jgi:hypothetical protein